MYTGYMPHAYRLLLDAGADDLSIIGGELSDEEFATLDRFLDQYEALVDSQPVRNGVPCEVTIRIENGRASVTTDLPSQDELDILFQRLRLFILQKERTSFVNICSILRRQLSDLRLLEFINGQHAAFHNHPDELDTAFVINNSQVNQEAMLMDWINGYQYHGDDERRDALRRLGVNPQSPIIRHKLTELLLNKQTAIFNVAFLIGVLIGRNPSLDIYGAKLSPAPPDVR
jgi:hypothetical protein